VEPTGQFFVSKPTRANYFACAKRACASLGLCHSDIARPGRRCKAQHGRGGFLTFQNETERERRRKVDEDGAGEDGVNRRPRKKKGQTADVGDALRSVYQTTVSEDIPPEMLDLLGKLG
jgi:hypothetical protein